MSEEWCATPLVIFLALGAFLWSNAWRRLRSVILRRVTRSSASWGPHNYKRTWVTSRRGVWTRLTRFGSISGSRTVKYSAQSTRFRRSKNGTAVVGRRELVMETHAWSIFGVYTHQDPENWYFFRVPAKVASVKNRRYLRIFARSVPVHTQMNINKFYCTFSTILKVPVLYCAYHNFLL